MKAELQRKLRVDQCHIKGDAKGAAAPGPRSFGGPQLVGVVSWLQVCKGPTFDTAPKLALMRPWSG